MHGMRDRAILLLFARLGLRAGDVLNMQLDDIDWAAGTVLVSGKGRREVPIAAAPRSRRCSTGLCRSGAASRRRATAIPALMRAISAIHQPYHRLVCGQPGAAASGDREPAIAGRQPSPPFGRDRDAARRRDASIRRHRAAAPVARHHRAALACNAIKLSTDHCVTYEKCIGTWALIREPKLDQKYSPRHSLQLPPVAFAKA